MEGATRQHIKLANKLYECQECAKSLCKDEYPAKIKFYVDVINDFCGRHEVETLPAVIHICNLPSVKDNGMAIMMFMAAAVEIIEPNDKKQRNQGEGDRSVHWARICG